jgi:hypothetical protein
LLSCTEVLARHSEYLDGEMTPPDTERWRAHLAECAMCARYDRVLRKGTSLLAAADMEPDPEFTMHLRYRIADEHYRSTRPMNNSVAVAMSTAAVLALIAWLPLILISRTERDVAAQGETAPASSEIAWHGSIAIDDDASHSAPAVDAAVLAPNHAAVALIAPGYSPLVIESPIAPPSYSSVRLTSLTER